MTQTGLAEEQGPDGVTNGTRPGRLGLALVLVLAFVELVLIGLIYKHLVDFRCLSNWPQPLCRGASMTMVAAYTASGALILLGTLLPDDRRRLLAEARPRGVGLILNLLGVAAMLAPLPFFTEGSGTTYLAPILSFWALGFTLGLIGTALMLAPVARWRVFLRTRGLSFALCLLAGASVPALAQQIFPVWRLSVMADMTFWAVTVLMDLAGYELQTNTSTKTIGTETFAINVAPVCSGVEGIALVAIFVTLYLVLFRKTLSFPAALLLYPIGILASWLLNVVRISVLIAIGIGGNPDLAVGGFHSHAGWLLFTALSVSLLVFAQSSHWFTASHAAAAPVQPLREDPAVAAILPFALFMGSALFASTFVSEPGVVYPLRALVMAGALAYVWPVLRRIPIRLDPLALAVGAGIGVIWVITAPEPDGSVPYGALSGGLLVMWIATRVIGTVLLVPIIEELFFRRYLIGLIAPEGAAIWRLAIAVAVTTAGFAALHDRWIEAAVAGLAFAAVYLRNRDVSAAIQSHALANAVVAAAAVVAGNWDMI